MTNERGYISVANFNHILSASNDNIQSALDTLDDHYSHVVVAAIYTTAAGQSISNAGEDIVNFDTLVKDTNSAVTIGVSWKFTAPYTGFYHLDCQILFAGTATWAGSEAGRMDLYKNNALLAHLDYKDNYSASDLYMSLGGGTLIYLTAADYVNIRLNQNSGAALALQSDAAFNRIAIWFAGT